MEWNEENDVDDKVEDVGDRDDYVGDNNSGGEASTSDSTPVSADPSSK